MNGRRRPSRSLSVPDTKVAIIVAAAETAVIHEIIAASGAIFA